MEQSFKLIPDVMKKSAKALFKTLEKYHAAATACISTVTPTKLTFTIEDARDTVKEAEVVQGKIQDVLASVRAFDSKAGGGAK